MVLDFSLKQHVQYLLANPESVIKKACVSNNVSKLDNLWTLISTMNCNFKLEIKESVLEYACGSGDIESVKYLVRKIYSQYGLDFIKKIIQNCFDSACNSGNVALVKYIYDICEHFKITPYLPELEDNDILQDIVINNHADVLRYILSLDKVVDLGLGLDEKNDYTVYSKSIKVDRISYLFAVACKNNNPDIAILLLNNGFDITIYEGFFEDLILKENIEVADLFLEINMSFNKDVDFAELSEKVAKLDNYLALEWMIKKKLVPSFDKLALELLKLSIDFQSINVYKFLINEMKTIDNIDKNNLLKCYASLLIGPIKENTQNMCTILKDLLKEQKIDEIYKVEKDSFQYCVNSLNADCVANILGFIDFTILDLKMQLINLSELDGFGQIDKVVKIFNNIYPKVKNFLEPTEKDTIIDLFSRNSGSSDILNILHGNYSVQKFNTPLYYEEYDKENSDYYSYPYIA